MKKVLMTIVLVLNFVACDDRAKYKDFYNEPIGSHILYTDDVVYKDAIIGWYTDDNKYLVVSVPLVSGSGVNRIKEYYIKPYTNSRGETADILVIKLKKK